MTSAAILAYGALSGMGEGVEAASAGAVGQPARVFVRADEELTALGLNHPFAARARLPEGPGDRATRLLLRAAEGCVRELDVALPSWRRLRIGLALGTSSGGMRSAETLFASYVAGSPAAGVRSADALYFAPLAALVAKLEVDLEPVTLVMGACAASTLALGLGLRWIQEGACDLVLAGGFDSVSPLVAAGFEALRATTSTIPPRPFRASRDGLSLGEGAALLALVPSAWAHSAGRVHLTGFGVSSDAVHLTAPDRTGAGLASAAKAALMEAGLTRVDLVSAHGTATPFSDAAEARAIARALPEQAADVVVYPLKAQIGHTLGAAGALESLAAADALARGVYPAAAGEGPLDPDASVNLLGVAQAGSLESALKLSSAFGGLNAAVVLTRTPRSPPVQPAAPPAARVYVRPALYLAELPPPSDLATAIAWPIERVLRADGLTRWTLATIAALVLRDGPLRGAGILVGTSFATLETDASLFARVHEKGARFVEARRFPYTSPNAAAGDAGLAFGLTGPSFAVGSGLHAGLEALAVAADFIRAGDARTMVVVAVDDVGPTVTRLGEELGIPVSAGAVAVVLSADPLGARAQLVSARSGAFVRRPGPVTAGGYRALLPLLESTFPVTLEATTPDFSVGAPPHASVAWARVSFGPLGAPSIRPSRCVIDAPRLGP